ncbi:MAG: elongation factor Ts [Chitinophagales bacterium]|nr:elongation factor Ts [Hyphomicrobiales bacterium]
MSAITAQMVKDLREKTGVGMMDCKAALTENNGDFEASVDWLRAKGLAKAAKKAGRIAADGLVAVAADGKQGAMVEVNSETDFVARNPEFQSLVSEVSKLALKLDGDLDKLLTASYPKKKIAVAEVVKELVITIGENLNVRRTAHLKVKAGVVASYVHSQVEPGLGKIGVLVALESEGKADKLNDLGRKIAMHIAATNPLALTAGEVSSDIVERERAIFAEQAKESGKAANIVEKMVDGRIKKFYQEVVLLQQAFVLNPDMTVEQAIKDAEKDAGAPIQMTGFVRFALGEGIEKKEDDFAAEVAAAAGSSPAPKSDPAAKGEVPAKDKAKASAAKAKEPEKAIAAPAKSDAKKAEAPAGAKVNGKQPGAKTAADKKPTKPAKK